MGTQSYRTILFKHDNQNLEQVLLETYNKGGLENVDECGHDKAEDIKQIINW